MPSRRVVAGIVLFWLATSAFVGYHELWPRLFSGDPPPIQIDLADEAAQSIPTSWTVYRGEHKIGELTTRMQYIPHDDSFQFINTYRNLTFDYDQINLQITKLDTTIRVSRSGDLREQFMSGIIQGQTKTRLGMITLGDASAEVTGFVEDGQLVGTCRIWYPANAAKPTIDRPLEPVPVPSGQVLNPMMPLSRLRDVRPGRRWVIREVDPLRDALNILMKESFKSSQVVSSALPQKQNQELIAEVLRTPVNAERQGKPPVPCWLIEYRTDEAQARTWVAVEDGRVIRQEATGFGEQLRFERQD